MARRPLSFALLLSLLLSAQLVATDNYLLALPAIVQTLGPASTSLTVFTLVFGIGQLPMDSLANCFGRHQVLLIGLTCYVLAALAGALTTTASMLTAACAPQGFPMAAILVCARAAVRDLRPARDGSHVMTRGLTGLGFVALVALILGAFVVQHAGRCWVLVGMSFYAIVLWAMCWYGSVEARHETLAQAGSVRAISSSVDFRAWDLLTVATYTGIFCFLLLSLMAHIAYLGLSPELYSWIPAGGSLACILDTAGCRRLPRRQSPVWMVQQGVTLSVAGVCIQTPGCWLLPGHAWPLLIGHAIYHMGRSIHQFYGQAGVVGGLSHLVGRAVSWSGFIMMLAAFCPGQTAAAFDDASHNLGAWSMVAPMMPAGVVLAIIAFLWLPKLQHQLNARRAAAQQLWGAHYHLRST